ncbi:Isochorismatase-like protein [Mycena olivaceomarginata]|nr:Isochorismatase-like protein [Mycena olivaceomarginata]
MASKAALVIVDLQEDFCPPGNSSPNFTWPNGSLAVSGGRDIVPIINSLLRSPLFDLKVATKDWHPEDHISFAANHPEPNNRPFESFATTRLWPVHCVQGTLGAELVPDLDIEKVDKIVEKGQDQRDPCVARSELGGYLKENGVGNVYVVGLAMDYWRQSYREDADATKAVDPGEGWKNAKVEMENIGIRFVGSKDISK